MIKKNILANIVGKFWSLFAGFLFIPLYINYLGFESYSIISFSLLIGGVMAVLDAGLTATLSREFARRDNDLIDKVKVFKTLECIYVIITVFCILLIFFSSDFIAEKWISISKYNSSEVSVFLKIMSLDIGCQLLLRFYLGGLLGLEKQVKANFFQICWGVFRNGIVVLLIMFSPSLITFFLWQSVSTFIFVLLIKMSLEKELLGRISLAFSVKIEKVVFDKIKNFAGGMLLIAVVLAVNTQMDKIAISKLLSLESLGYYTLAIALSQGLVILVNPIATALLPRFTALYSEEKVLDVTKLFSKFNLIVSILVFGILANMMFFSYNLVWVWTGNQSLTQNVYQIIPIVAFSYAMIALQVLPYNIAIANGYTKLNNILGIVSLVITLPGYWIATTKYGVLGAAYVFCAVQFITTFIYIYFINAKFLKINFLKTFCVKQLLLPFLLSLTVAYLFSLFIEKGDGDRIVSLLLVGISTIFTLFITSAILLHNDLKLQYLKIKNILKS